MSFIWFFASQCNNSLGSIDVDSRLWHIETFNTITHNQAIGLWENSEEAVLI
jgi:hypothetical protein